MKDVPRFCRHVRETMPGISCQQHGFAVMQMRVLEFNGVDIVSLRDQQVLPPVIVVVHETKAPARMQTGHPSKAGGKTRISKAAIAVVPVERVDLVSEIVNHEVRKTI